MEKQEIKYLENKIKETISKIYSKYFEVFVETEKYSKDESDDWKIWIYEEIKRLYYQINAYLSARNLNGYMKLFNDNFDYILSNHDKTMKSHLLYSEVEPTLIVLDNIESFLIPFSFFDGKYKINEKLSILEEVLNHTDQILKKTNKEITGEASIYNEIKWFLELIFADVRNRGKSRFIKKYKSYQPDLLIPSLKTAVEYKIIRKNKNIDDYIDQIKTDADNYEYDSEYDNFYAVIYFLDKTEVKESAIRQAWKEKKLPKNWKLIICTQ